MIIDAKECTETINQVLRAVWDQTSRQTQTPSLSMVKGVDTSWVGRGARSPKKHISLAVSLPCINSGPIGEFPGCLQ